jgi:hypothetical protein
MVALPVLGSMMEVSKMGSSVALKNRAERMMDGLAPFMATVAKVPLEHSAEKPLMVLVNMVAQPAARSSARRLSSPGPPH